MSLKCIVNIRKEIRNNVRDYIVLFFNIKVIEFGIKLLMHIDITNMNFFIVIHKMYCHMI